jgi:crotonobetainyl-CoA:carnitine CoA-transferase CaiB-like acyl-CoA transferase
MEKEPSSKSKLRILDLSMFWAGAACAGFLGDLGMEVIKIESCQHPDPDRIVTQGLLYLHNELGEEPWNRGMIHLRRHRNKLGITLDLATHEGKDLFLRLVKVSDMVVENFRVGVLEKLGIEYRVLQAANPQIILISVSSQGYTGPERTYGSNAEILAFTSGVRSISDYRDEIGLFTAANIPDPLAGTVAAGFALAALRQRRKTGKGLHVVLSQRELLTGCIGEIVMDYPMNQRIPQPQGNQHPFYAPHGCYPCEGKDSWIALVARDDNEWENLCRAMDNPELLADARFSGVANRLRHRDEIDKAIASWTVRRKKEEVMKLLQEKGVPASALFSVPDLVEDPHLKARGFWDRIDDPRPGFGTYLCKGRGITLSKPPLKTERRAPDLGEHNDYVFKTLLGISQKEVDVLEKQGIIGRRPVPEVLSRIPKSLPKARRKAS